MAIVTVLALLAGFRVVGDQGQGQKASSGAEAKRRYATNSCDPDDDFDEAQLPLPGGATPVRGARICHGIRRCAARRVTRERVRS